MKKWKCVLCWAQCESEVKPDLGQRLCAPCKVRHYERLVQLYKHLGGLQLAEAKRNLAAAKKEAK